jgi:hypothetical protein
MKQLVYALLILIARAGDASAFSIVAVSSGSTAPPTAPPGSTIANGDFLITDTGGGSPIAGDGWNEITDWSFNFAAEPDWAAFSHGTVVQSARLTLTLFIGGPEPATDMFQLGALGPVSDAAFASLAPGATATIDFDLLNHYESSSVVSSLLSGGGVIAASYSDDAIVSFARLDITAVPEPSTALLFGLGLSGMAMGRKFSIPRGTP